MDYSDTLNIERKNVQLKFFNLLANYSKQANNNPQEIHLLHSNYYKVVDMLSNLKLTIQESLANVTNHIVFFRSFKKINHC